jgi:mono/diheme cytochrome c family protein
MLRAPLRVGLRRKAQPNLKNKVTLSPMARTLPTRSIASMLIGMAGLSCGLSSGAQTPDTAALQNGRNVYMQNQCYSCHGTHGQGGERNAGPRIAPNPFPFAAFEMQLRKPRSVMPRYTERDIDAARLKDLYAFVQSMPAAPALSSIPLLRDAMRTP